MTQVDFYVLTSGGVSAALQYTCRLTEKAWRMGHDIYIHTPDANLAEQLDELLWSFSPESFLPHARSEASSETARERVLIGSDAPAGHSDVLVNLTQEIPPFFSRFHRVAEIVCQEPAWLAAGRERYRFYSDRGYPLAKHDISR